MPSNIPDGAIVVTPNKNGKWLEYNYVAELAEFAIVAPEHVREEGLAANQLPASAFAIGDVEVLGELRLKLHALEDGSLLGMVYDNHIVDTPHNECSPWYETESQVGLVANPEALETLGILPLARRIGSARDELYRLGLSAASVERKREQVLLSANSRARRSERHDQGRILASLERGLRKAGVLADQVREARQSWRERHGLSGEEASLFFRNELGGFPLCSHGRHDLLLDMAQRWGNHPAVEAALQAHERLARSA